MRISITEALSKLPLPATSCWPQGVWDIEADSHGSMSLLLFTPRGRDYQSSHKQDELYIVINGQGILVVGGRCPVRACRLDPSFRAVFG